MIKVEGNAINERDDHWQVECPACARMFEYEGFFDSSDVTECKCECKFTTNKIWINENQYIT